MSYLRETSCCRAITSVNRCNLCFAEMSGKQNLFPISELSSAHGSPTAYRYFPSHKMVQVIRCIRQLGRHFCGFNILTPNGVQRQGDHWELFQSEKVSYGAVNMVHLETRKQCLFQLSKTWKRGVPYRFQTNVTRLFKINQIPPPPPPKKVQVHFLGTMNQPCVRNSEMCLLQYINQNDMKQ